ncbi:SIR2 family NAD-dependent protein deacylase [Tenuifilum thalassicum]|uniref:protein acetyllysine N-acetyltransferase n=1 Tax=Tenuifilum thalassicum TaxID=2590900 RepID=A0A7D4BSN5_9BACT|nr:NAD-dependent deacylase [Tenuifilum thalassicum]QKG80561.1 NAD-dependent deacylase [Tenuifilum thalassicum]
MRKRLVVLTGAGISAESGIRTFRDMGGLWEEYDVMEVASIEGWQKNPQLVLEFYNQRRRQLKSAKPNAAHLAIANAENDFDIYVITQNVDNLHERAGSSKVMHLHGELTKARPVNNPNNIIDIGYNDIKWGDNIDGYQLRPHVVWFGEDVPMLTEAAKIVQTAEIFAVVGTSLNVYPAAGLLDYAPKGCPIYLIDPNDVNVWRNDVTFIKDKASVGVPAMLKMIKDETP